MLHDDGAASAPDMTRGPAADAGLFQALLESAPDAMVIVDTEGVILLVNAQAERVFGYRRADLVGERVEILVPERLRKSHARHRGFYFGAAHPRPMGAGLELYGRRKDGTEFPVEISLSPIPAQSGTLVASAIRDITDRKQAQAERERLMQERAAQAEANQLKDEFLATLSHELRTPLNVLTGEVWRLRTGALPPDRVARSWASVDRNLQLLTRLVEDLLDVSRVVTGKLPLALQPVDLATVVDNAVEVVRAAATAKGITLVRPLSGDSTIVLGDAARLQQVVWNLLSNAVKFTDAGGRIDVEVSRVETFVEVAITDTGIGIAPEFLPRVFDRFAQADPSVTRQYAGLGLGLAIVRHLTELHGGTARASSEGLGQGARFAVRFPVPAVLPHTSAGAPRTTAPARLDGVRVLLVDDQPDAREAVGAVLTHFGAVVRTAGSVDDALAAVGEFDPDVLLSDLAMPGRDGYALLEAIRRREPADSHVPAIALTAYADPEHRLRTTGAGFQLHVTKPVQPRELAAVIHRLSQSHPRRPQH